MQLAKSQQPGDLARCLVGMIGVGEDPVGQQPEGATEAGSLGPDCLRRQKHRGAMVGRPMLVERHRCPPRFGLLAGMGRNPLWKMLTRLTVQNTSTCLPISR